MSDAGVHWTIEEGAENGRVLIRLDQLPKKIHLRLKAEIDRLTHQLLARVEAAEPVRTGTLRQQTEAYLDQGINKGGRWVRGRVRVLRDDVSGVNYGKVAGALEYGAPGKRRTGPVPVAGYRRQSVKVRTHTRRRPKIQAMRFLRGPAAAMRPQARARLMAIINEALKEE
jgi:hypothetical protein